MSHSPTPWIVGRWTDRDEWTVNSSEDGILADDCTKANAERIVACVNACTGISNEALTSFDWQLAPKAGAKPVDVAKLILTLGKYREALAKIASNPLDYDVVVLAEEALK